MPIQTFSHRVAQTFLLLSTFLRSHSLLILIRPQEDDIHEISDQGPNSRTPSDNGLSTLPEISTNPPEGLTGDSTTDNLIGDSTLDPDHQRVVMTIKQDTSGSKTLG